MERMRGEVGAIAGVSTCTPCGAAVRRHGDAPVAASEEHAANGTTPPGERLQRIMAGLNPRTVRQPNQFIPARSHRST
jgi:hypothetical protein